MWPYKTTENKLYDDQIENLSPPHLIILNFPLSWERIQTSCRQTNLPWVMLSGSSLCPGCSFPQCCENSVPTMSAPTLFLKMEHKKPLSCFISALSLDVLTKVQKATEVKEAGQSLKNTHSGYIHLRYSETLCLCISCSCGLTVPLPISVWDSHLSNQQPLTYCPQSTDDCSVAPSVIHSFHAVPG